MVKKYKISANIPKDKKGYTGRECPVCEEYFKVKGGTGLKTDMSYCPYCNHYGKADTFYTKDQIKYGVSILKKQVIKEFSRKIHNSLKKL